MSRLPQSLHVLRRRDFRLLFLGKTISVLGDRMVAVALAFAVLQLGGSPTQVGLVLAAQVFPSVGGALVGGVLADRASRRTVMVWADLTRVASQGAMAVLLIGGGAEIWMLAALAAITGVGAGFFGPASLGLLPEVVAPDELQPANALRASGTSAGEIIGPIFAGLLVAGAGAGWAIAADAATFAVSSACLISLRLPVPVPMSGGSFIAGLREGWVAFSSRRWVLACVVYFAMANLSWGAWSALGPVVADRDLGGAAAWGAILGAVGAGALLGSAFATQVRPARPLIFVALSEVLVALPLAFLAATQVVAILIVGALLCGAGLMLGMSVWESTLQRHVPADALSRVSSFDWFGSFAFQPIGLAIWGPIASLSGLHTALWISFALFIASIFALVAIPAVRELPWAPPVAAGIPVVSPAVDRASSPVEPEP